MVIRKARAEDLDRIEAIYDGIHDAEEAGQASIGWKRGVYPVRGTAEDALERGDMFVMEDGGSVVAAAVINRIQVPDYARAKWKHDPADDGIMVLHTLAVDPACASRGFGKAFVAYYERYARDNGCRELRMDTNAINARARAMYRRLGYEEADVVACEFNGIPGVRLVCLEKRLG